MSQNRVAFNILDDGQNIEPGRTFLDFYMVFDVKMGFIKKARYVANGAKTPDFKKNNYLVVVSRETVKIVFIYAVLNGLDIMSADIQNTYLQAPVSEKYWTICGPEFGPKLQGCKARIVRPLYGCKSAGIGFRNHLRSCMKILGYEPCLADPDLWMREAVSSSGEEYYDYMLLYVDDALCCSEFPREACMQIDNYFPMKVSSIGPHIVYFGEKRSKVQLHNGGYLCTKYESIRASSNRKC